MSPILGIYASSMRGAVGDYQSIATVTVGSGGQASVDFTSIPNTYTHLEVRFIAKASTQTRMRLQINADTATNYSTHLLLGNGSSAFSAAGPNEPKIAISSLIESTANTFCAGVVSILEYKDTNKFKTVRSLSGFEDNTSNSEMALGSGAWRSTNAVTSLKFYLDSGNLGQYSSFGLYGIKG